MAVSHLDSGEEETRSLGWNLVNIHQELDADHLTAAQRPVGHQRFPGIDAAQVGGVAGNAANALLFEISDHVGTRSGPAFGGSPGPRIAQRTPREINTAPAIRAPLLPDPGEVLDS